MGHLNIYHAQVIDDLRRAAATNDAVAVLLKSLSSSFPAMVNNDFRFCGTERDKSLLIAAQDAACFVAIDKNQQPTDV